MHILEKYKLPGTNEVVTEQFFNQLFTDVDSFIGIHDKKVRKDSEDYRSSARGLVCGCAPALRGLGARK